MFSQSSLLRSLVVVITVGITASTALPAAPGTSLLPTLDLSPGADAYQPAQFALNHLSHKLYVLSGRIPQNGKTSAIKVIDTTTNAVIAGIDLGNYVYPAAFPPNYAFIPYGLTVDESAGPAGNKLYVRGSINGSQAVVRIIDGSADTNATGQNTDVALPGSSFGAQVGYSEMAVNPTNHKVYVHNSAGAVIVIDGPNRTVLKTITTNVGGSGHVLVVNPVANKVFVFGANSAAVIDSTTDTVTPLTIAFYTTDAVFDPTNGRIYVAGYDPNDGQAALYAFDGTTGASLGSAPLGAFSSMGRSITADPGAGRIYVGLPTGVAAGNIAAFDATDLSAKGTFAQGASKLACDTNTSSRLHLLDGSITNAVGVLNPADATLQRVTVGFSPGEVAVNPKTNRVFIVDNEAAELTVLDGATRATIAHIASNNPEGFGRHVGVSVALDRIYSTWTDRNGSKGYVEIFDGTSYALLQTLTLNAADVGTFGALAVDDTRRRLYVGSSSVVNSARAYFVSVYNLDSNALVTNLPVPDGVRAIAVNSVTGRVYVSPTAAGKNKIQIIDGATNAIIGSVAAGSVPGGMAVNTKTNKVYVANTGADSVDNSVTVINGATSAFETTFKNTTANNGDTVDNIAVDEVSNTIYVADDANGADLTGRVTVFDGANNNAFLGQFELGRYPIGIVFNSATRQLFVTNGEDGTVSVLENATAKPADLLGNISTRARVASGDNVLIGGFIVTGPQGSTKKVLVRAIGPSLAAAGVIGALTDTLLTLRDSAGNVYTNDNWKGDPGQASQQTEIAATGIPPSDDRESAIIATVPTGPTTAVVTGNGGTGGVALVEVYDLQTGAATELANISTRGKVETAGNVMIGGVIVLGAVPQKVMLRAIGPSLTNSGVQNALQDTILELRDPNGALIVSNDDWQTRDSDKSSQVEEIQATTIPPIDPRESAAVATLYPNNYTAVVRGKGDTTGVALVEAYNLH